MAERDLEKQQSSSFDLARSPTSSTTSSSEHPELRSIALQRTQTAPDDSYDRTDPVTLSRERTANSIYLQTVGSRPTPSRRGSKASLPAFGGGRPYPPDLPSQDVYVVDFTGPNDPLHGQNWSLRRKVITAAVLGYTTFVAAWGSSIYSALTIPIMRQFHIGSEVATLGLSFYVLGFAVGPLIWAPFSELKGRRMPLVISTFGFSIFTIAVAAAKDLQTLLLSRFFGGVFAAGPLAVVGAVFADIFSSTTRGTAVAIFSMMVFTGPMLAPIVAGYMLQSNVDWRWAEYMTGMMGFLAFTLVLIFLEESYPPVILITKAAELRRRTKNWGIHAKQEEIEVDFRELLERNFSRPLKMLFTEPIIFLVSLYTAFVYGILYLFLTAYPTVFYSRRHWSPGNSALPFLGLITGMILGALLVIAFQPWQNRRTAARGYGLPEDRLAPIIIGSVFFPIGLFWFSWTGQYNSIHWIAPTLSGLFSGIGLMTIFLQALNYLIDAYLVFAASAIAANTILRSIFGAVFPLFAKAMFSEKPLGVGWAGSILGFAAVLMIPIPILFWIYGERIRRRSKWAPTDF